LVNFIHLRTASLILLFLAKSFGAMAQLPSDKLFRTGYYYLSVDNDKSIEYLTKAIERDSTRAKYYFFRGIAKFKLGDYNRCIFDFNKAGELDSALSITHMYQGMAYKNLGMYWEASAQIDEFIQKNDHDSTGYAYLIRGKARLAAEDFEGALSDFTLLTETFPQVESGNYYRLVAFLQMGDYSSALEDVNLLLEENPDFYGYYFYRGNIYFGLGNFHKAIQDYSTSLIYNEYNADAYYKRGMVLDTLKRHQEAIENYTYAIALNSSDGVYYSHRGNSRFTAGNKEGACLDWTIAGNLGYYEDFDKVSRFCD